MKKLRPESSGLGLVNGKRLQKISLWTFTILFFTSAFFAPSIFGGQQPDTTVPKSNVIVRFEWMGDQIEYRSPSSLRSSDTTPPSPSRPNESDSQPRGDTFPMTWADDDEIYTSAGDPLWGGKHDGLDIEKISGMPPKYTITKVNPMPDYKGYGGRGTKPSGIISVDGVLYFAFQNLLGEKPPVYGTKSQHGSDATIVSSRDHGKTWSPKIGDIKSPMFPGNRFGGPTFVNNGRDNIGAPDSYIYAVSTDQWDNGSKLRVGRVPANRIQDASAWEWISDLKDSDHPQWSHHLEQAIPVFSKDRHVSLPDMVYVARIKRYLLLTWRLHEDFSPTEGSELMIYDSPHPWGPFTLVHAEEMWESKDMNPYCPRLPLKWLSVNGNELTGWIQFSGSWRKDSPRYRSHIREFKMTLAPPLSSRLGTRVLDAQNHLFLLR